MLPILFTVWLLHLAATVTPGANTLLVTQLASADRGPSAVYAAFGVAVGSALWAALAVLGMDMVFMAFPALRISLQIAGATYLLYLAARLWKSGSMNSLASAHSVPPVKAFRRGALTNFTNPKAALFFGSVFSSCFPVAPSPMLLAASVLVVFVNAASWYALLGYLFSRKPVREAYLRNHRALGKLAATVLGTIGLRFVLVSLREASS